MNERYLSGESPAESTLPAPQSQEEAIAQVNDFRARLNALKEGRTELNGQPIARPTREEMRAALDALRAGRSAAASAAGKRKTKAAAPVDLDKLWE